MNDLRGPKSPWLKGFRSWKGSKTKINMVYSYPPPMLNSQKLYWSKFWTRSGISLKTNQWGHYKSPRNWIIKTLTQVCLKKLVQTIACCDTRGSTPNYSMALSGSTILWKVSVGSLVCNYLYKIESLLKYMESYLRKNSSKRLNYSEKRSNFQQHLFSTLLELKH